MRSPEPTDNTDDKVTALMKERVPDIVGRSKELWRLDDGMCAIRLIPSLRSFTYQRDEIVEDTGPLRLDFYERASEQLRAAGVRTSFVRRLGPTAYLSEFHEPPPFEVIVKNRAVGSTVVKYPGLFEPDAPLPRPVVKFDYRTDPEDQPIGEDYLRVLGLPVDEMRRLALTVNDVLRAWLEPIEVVDFCVIFGLDGAEPVLISEVSQDCIRMRHPDGSSLDKDLFRRGAPGAEIIEAWRRVLHEAR